MGFFPPAENLVRKNKGNKLSEAARGLESANEVKKRKELENETAYREGERNNG